MQIPEKYSKNDIQKIGCVSARTVDRWYSEGLPFEGGGHRGAKMTTRQQFIDFYSKRCEKQGAAKANALRTADGEPLSHEEESLRLIKEQADKLELANAQTRKEMGSIPDFEQSFRGAMVVIRREMLAIGSRMPPSLAEETDQAVIKQMLIDQIKRALDACVETFFELRDSRPDDSATEEDIT